MRTAFKTTKQTCGKINGLVVAKSSSGEFGIILCQNDEEANGIRALNSYKKGFIVEMKDTENMSNNDIFTHPSVNPGNYSGNNVHPLWKMFDLDELGRLANLDTETMKEIHDVVMEYAPAAEEEVKGSTPAGDEDAKPLSKADQKKKEAEYKNRVMAELRECGQVFGKMAPIEELVKLLTDAKPDSELLPKKTEEEKKAELLGGDQ